MGEDHLSLLLDAVGLADVQVESETFNREWRIRSEDRVAAVAVLTPEVQVALQGRADDWALEIRDGLVSIHQLGVPAEGSGLAACFDELVALTGQILAGLRPHTWPDTRPADWTDAPITVDHRPAGMAHPNSGSPGCSGAFFIGIGVFFAAIGSLFVLLSFVIPDL